jgi:hypothetical protein
MPYSEAVRPTRLEDFVSSIQTEEYEVLQCNFSPIRYEHRGKRFDCWRNSGAVTDGIGTEQLAREVGGLSYSAHFHNRE